MTDNILKKHVERTAKELVAEVYPADKTYRDLADKKDVKRGKKYYEAADASASREPALADRRGAHPQHHGASAQTSREGARPARVRVSRRGLSCLTSPVVADDGRTRVFVAFRDAERFVSDGAGTARVVSAAQQPPRRRFSCLGRRPGRLGRKVSTGFGPARKYFSPNVFGGLVKIRDKLSLKIRDKRGGKGVVANLPVGML